MLKQTLTSLFIYLFAFQCHATLIEIKTDLEQGICYTADVLEIKDCDLYQYGINKTSTILIDIDDSVLDFESFEDNTYSPNEYVEYRYQNLIKSVTILFDDSSVIIENGRSSLTIGESVNSSNFSNHYGLDSSQSVFGIGFSISGFDDAILQGSKPILDFDKINLAEVNYKMAGLSIHDEINDLQLDYVGEIKSIKVVSVPETQTLILLIAGLLGITFFRFRQQRNHQI